MKHLPLKSYFWTTLILNLAVLVLVLVLQKRLPPEVPLFYSLPLGEEQLTKPLGLLLPCGLTLIISFLNLFLVKLIKDEFGQKMLVWANLAISILAAITTLKIIFLICPLF